MYAATPATKAPTATTPKPTGPPSAVHAALKAPVAAVAREILPVKIPTTVCSAVKPPCCATKVIAFACSIVFKALKAVVNAVTPLDAVLKTLTPVQAPMNDVASGITTPMLSPSSFVEMANTFTPPLPATIATFPRFSTVFIASFGTISFIPPFFNLLDKTLNCAVPTPTAFVSGVLISS